MEEFDRTMKYRSKRSVSRLLILATRKFRLSESAILLGIATFLGLLVGLSIWLFRTAIDLIQQGTAALQTHLSPIPAPLVLLVILVLAGAIVGLIMDRFIGEERHHGVAGIMEAVALADGRLRYQRMPFKAISSAISLGAGASVGPEDPSVQIGANLGSWAGQALHLKADHV